MRSRRNGAWDSVMFKVADVLHLFHLHLTLLDFGRD